MITPEIAKQTVADVLRVSPVFDGHNDLPEALRTNAGYCVDGLDQLRLEFQTDLKRLKQGGVGAQFWSAWVPASLSPGDAVQSTLEQIDAIHRLVAAYPDRLAFAVTGDDVRRAWSAGKIASLIGIEGGHSIGRSPAVLRMFAQLGARYMTLTHSDNIAWADSATDEPAVGGLTDEGRAVVALMEQLGVIVDLSHVAATTMRDALAVVTRPVLFSHSSAFAVTPHPRNVPDDVLELVAANGGVVQATFVPGFICTPLFEWEQAMKQHYEAQGLALGFGFGWMPAPRAGESPAQVIQRGQSEDVEPSGASLRDAKAAWQADHPRPEATIDDVVAHIEHLREVAGVDHVGIGGDYDGVDKQPAGLDDVSGYPRLLEALATRGWSSSDLAKLTSGNVLRVLDANPTGVA
ncbi:MAG: dipeptidase [Propionibacteriaceae bacterium]|nr:dipeptidase [Propionibacteriaceae bacterium]